MQVESIDQDQLGQDDGGALKVDGLPGVVAESLDIQHGPVNEAGKLRQGPLEVGKERRVVESPFRSVLFIPSDAVVMLVSYTVSPRSTIPWGTTSG